MLRRRKEGTFSRNPESRSGRMKAHVFLRLFCVAALCGTAEAYVTEHEPNGTFATANVLQCTDTVYCATLTPWNDLDYFRFHAFYGDSIVAYTLPCEGNHTDTYLILYNDRDSILAADDDGGMENFSRINWASQYSGDYTLRVHRLTATTDSTYCLVVGCPRWLPEAFDVCATARVIPAFPYYDEATTFGAHSECGTLAADVFYKFHNPVADGLVITVCSDHFDARVQVLGSCCNDFGDDADQGCNQGAVLSVQSLPPGDFYIMVEGTSANQAGNFSLDVTAHLPGCPQPDSVTVFTVGGYPFLDWPEQVGPTFWVIWCSNYVQGPYEHLGTTTQTFYVDSSGYVGARRYYRVTAECPW